MQIIPSLLTPVLGQAASAANGPDLTRYFMVCGLIVFLIIGLGYGFRRLFSASLKRRASGRSLRLVDVLPLGGKQRLGVVRCYDRTFLLGLGERDVTLVAELDSIIGAEPAGKPVAGTKVAKEDFVQLLENAQERIHSTNAGIPKSADERRTELVG
ncbi:MAG: flagellar biogenesis protein FliO [Chlamydiales bacterium]|jgi:flagellar biogenesis protein FliO